jgi:hypothetical protein
MNIYRKNACVICESTISAPKNVYGYNAISAPKNVYEDNAFDCPRCGLFFITKEAIEVIEQAKKKPNAERVPEFIADPLTIEPNNRYVETNYLDLSTEHFQMQF